MCKETSNKKSETIYIIGTERINFIWVAKRVLIWNDLKEESNPIIKKRTGNGIEDLEIGDLKKNRNQLKIDYEKNEGRQEQKVLASPLRINRMDKDKI